MLLHSFWERFKSDAAVGETCDFVTSEDLAWRVEFCKYFGGGENEAAMKLRHDSARTTRLTLSGVA
jgi:hypothetical protein